MVSGKEPHFHVSPNVDPYPNKQKISCAEFYKYLPGQFQSENNMKNQPGEKFHQAQFDPTIDTTGSNRNHCITRFWIPWDMIITYMQKTTHIVSMENGNVLSEKERILLCALEDHNCGTTSLDLNAFILDYPDKCLLSAFRA